MTPEDKANLQNELEAQIPPAEADARANHRWDIGFRIGLLVIGLAIIVTSGIATADVLPTMTKLLTAVSGMLGAATSAISGFAFTQFDFGTRWATFETKASALKSLLDEVKFLDPDKQSVVERMEKIKAWGNNRKPEQLSSPKAAYDGHGTGGAAHSPQPG
jgi:hypothetical protein